MSVNLDDYAKKFAFLSVNDMNCSLKVLPGVTRVAEKLTVINERRSVDQLFKVRPPKTVTSIKVRKE